MKAATIHGAIVQHIILHNHWSFSVVIGSSLINTTSWRLLSLHYNVLDINVREPLRTRINVTFLNVKMCSKMSPYKNIATLKLLAWVLWKL